MLKTEKELGTFTPLLYVHL